jgi:peroxiredoxin
MARQLARDTAPQLERQSCKLFLVSIGTAETGQKFSELTGFPTDKLFADPENAAYDALRLNKGILVTYLSPIVRFPANGT